LPFEFASGIALFKNLGVRVRSFFVPDFRQVYYELFNFQSNPREKNKILLSDLWGGGMTVDFFFCVY
jgi:hypothetical protein